MVPRQPTDLPLDLNRLRFFLYIMQKILVDFASTGLDALLLEFIAWFVITGECVHLLPLLCTHDCSRVTHVADIARIAHDKRDYCT